MKTKLIFLLILGAMTLTFNISAQPKKTSGAKKILVAYYSHSGNTQAVANQIKEATGSDMFRIETLKAYPQEYNALVEQAKKEVESGYKPVIKGKVNDMDSYDIIFVGSPNWWGTIAPPVATFLSNYDLAGKTIIPFITHEGSRMGRSAGDIKKLCPRSTLLEGLPIRGSNAANARNDIKRWLQEIKITR